ncbi:MAG: tetratricopeptide repeat protein, partial [Gammaproteobacteria bacterium]|nr:tetratricopeptide repeat protein [Gammaproteobacteria bacterium]
MKALLALALAPLLAACSYDPHIMPGFMSTAPPTLADLQPVSLPQAGAELPAVSLAELEDIYRQVLIVTEDPATRLQVLHRLADIEMLQGEEELALTEARAPLFDEAIAAYQSLLQGHSNDPDNNHAKDRLLYQLSKAHELNGENDKSLAVLEQLSAGYPQSKHYVEAKFRLADSYFSSADYPAAERAYAQVIAREDVSAYYRNALYMHGWSQFKQGRYRPAIAAFSNTLDLLVPTDNDLETLGRGERELVLDSFRVLAVAFSYLQGPDTIAAAYRQLGHRHYQHLLYQHLGELYLRQQRYRDSAETYRAFNRSWPGSEHAHEFQISVIETYEAGGFRDLIITEKQHYVESYGVSGDYWANSSTAVKQLITSKLKLFIEELATYHHALGQSLAQSLAPSSALPHFLSAGDYYQLFVSSFANDPRVPEMVFLLAESRWEAGATEAAISAYEQVAYDFPDFPRAADAGYSAIVAYNALLAGAAATADDSSDNEKILRSRIDSQLRYASRFASDARAPLVLNSAAAALLELSEYQLAIIAAATLSHWQPTPGVEIMVPAWLIMAHSHFDTREYLPAEQAYQQALELMTSADTRRGDAVERLAASIYRQAEAAVVAQNYRAAADQFARVIDLAPQSSVRVQAQYDAAGNYMQAGEFARATRLLRDFRRRFSDHPLSVGIATRLVHNYQQLQQWENAAQELDIILATETDPERQRQLLYLAAEHYDKAGNSELAIHRYRSYAHGWPQPPAERFEAMNRLAELYAQSRQPQKRQFWLRKIMATYETAHSPQQAQQEVQQSGHSLYLAAFASSELAELEYQAYLRISIRAPLAKSLSRKKTAMQHALKAYQRTNDYAVAQFSTLATYKMGEIYRALSVDLLESERPGNIDPLALEQYELLLEEQAYPFEEKAIIIHEANARRSWEGIYDEWVQHSF